ncbi:hypothetical protein LCGC14_2478980 [marine sediment metagenome]|uniref:Uncharacterized protein n=1 Tax=marine sediment metagenome TaxID=412755 RepID=A0A0F9B854_9ZZZZ
MLNYMEIGCGKFKTLESNITEKRAEELQEEIDTFNSKSTNGIYRTVQSDFSEK